MSIAVWGNVGVSAAISLSAAGSCFGTGIAGLAAIGAWKRCILEDRGLPFILIAFVGAPLSQTIYGLLLMKALSKEASELVAAGTLGANFTHLIAAGIFGGIAIGLSALMQGKAAAAAADAVGETGKGLGNFIMVLGIIESVGLFVMVFLMLTIGKLA